MATQKVSNWIQKYVYPLLLDMRRVVGFDDSIPLRVLKVPVPLPCTENEILENDRVRHSYNLSRYNDMTRIICYLKIEDAHHLYLVETVGENLEVPISVDAALSRDIPAQAFRSAVESAVDWASLFRKQIKNEGYYFVNYRDYNDKDEPDLQYCGRTWSDSAMMFRHQGMELTSPPAEASGDS